MHFIGNIDRAIYSVVTPDIVTDEVIITDERIAHIKERHPNDYERFSSYLCDIVENPDYIVQANRPNTAMILKEIVIQDEFFKLALRLQTSKDLAGVRNSIITFMKIDMREWNRILRNKEILYKNQ